MRFNPVVLFAVFFSVTAVSPLSAQLRKVRFSVSAASIAEVPFRIANIKGFYRDEGLDVEMILIRGAVGMRALLGGVPRVQSRVRVLGREVTAGRPAAGIGYVPQVQSVNWQFPVTVNEVVLLGPVERCRERLAAFREAGIEYPLLAPQPVDEGAEAAGMRLLAAFAR